jgi:hypothetical protein
MHRKRPDLFKKKYGGLGFPKLETITTGASLKMGLKILESEDPVMKAITETSDFERRLKKIALAARLNWPLNGLEEIKKYKQRERKSELMRWAQLTSQGKAVSNLSGDRIANYWLSGIRIFKPSTYILALKMRTNFAGDRVSLARAKLRKDTTCRKCTVQRETLGHILGQCSSTKEE